MQIPTKKQCYHLMCEMKMMDHIVVHSMQVCRVATFLADRLKSRQNRFNYNLVQAAALLHDITKTRSFQTRENHAVTGGQYLADQGYAQVGELVRQHVRLDEYSNPVVLGEAVIINYADKRVLHDKVVSLDRRLEYILERYGKLPENQERIQWLWERTLDLEEKIFSDLSFAPEDLNRLLNHGNGPEEFLEYQKVCSLIEDSGKV